MSNEAVTHIKVKRGTNIIVCEKCGATYVPALPMDLMKFALKVKKFAEQHENCKGKGTRTNGTEKG